MQVGDQASQGSLGSLQRMVQNIAIASGTAIGSTVLNLFSGRLARKRSRTKVSTLCHGSMNP